MSILTATSATRLGQPHPGATTSRPALAKNGAQGEPALSSFRTAEFFAGIGLMAEALESRGYHVAWANDIERAKHDLYVSNRPGGSSVFRLGDVREVTGASLPPRIDLATASFPCIDLSLAGKREGLGGAQSGMFWEFARVLGEMNEEERPRLALLENVHGFASSRGGSDLRKALEKMNQLGYSCDVFAINARHFVAQSRPRMFVVGVRGELSSDSRLGRPPISDVRPEWVRRLYEVNSDLRLHYREMQDLPVGPTDLSNIVQSLPMNDSRWWDALRTAAFVDSLSALQSARLQSMTRGTQVTHRTAYRRTRNGQATWEIRADQIAGCLRTTGGGSSKQALVEAGSGEYRVRWMTPVEYARLMGVPNFTTQARTENQALFGFGDAVVVDVIRWIADQYLSPELERSAALSV